MLKGTSLFYYTGVLISQSQRTYVQIASQMVNVRVIWIYHWSSIPLIVQTDSVGQVGFIREGKMETTAGKGGPFPDCEHLSSCVCF